MKQVIPGHPNPPPPPPKENGIDQFWLHYQNREREYYESINRQKSSKYALFFWFVLGVFIGGVVAAAFFHQ